jgi:NAD(P)-dependent dehydrogenase (short-subunit alcohol dehydrogenase family)
VLDQQKRSVVVTGAASGIGLAVSRQLLDQGHSVIGVDIDAAGLSRLAAERMTTVVADLTEAAHRGRVVDAVGGSLDNLVNAAGILRFSPLAEVTEADWRDVFTVNVDALFFLTKQLVPNLNWHGAIVNVASMAAKTSEPEFIAYSAAKAAILSITRSLAFALAERGIRVNCVSPGIIDTPMQDVFVPTLDARANLSPEAFQAQRSTAVPLQRIGSPDDVASVITFLLSPEAGYVTGEDITVSGGLVTW